LFLLFCLPHKKVTKKVTAIGKFAKTAPQKAKNLNVAVKSYHKTNPKYPATSIFLTPFSLQFINAISQMRVKLA